MRLEQASPVIGVEVCDLDLREPIDAATASELQAAFRDHLLLLFRGQDLTAEDQRRAVGTLGPLLDEFGDGASHSLVSNVDRDAYIGGDPDRLELRYHSDLTNTASPPWGLSLYAIEVSENVPGTRYINVQRAYERLPEELRERIESVSVIDGYDADVLGDQPTGHPALFGHSATHPMVINHPRNGRRQIYCNRMFTHRVVGLEPAEATALLDEVYSYMYDPSNLFEHSWRTGDLIIWDNLAVQHGRSPIPPGVTRRFRRVPMGEGTPDQMDASRAVRDYALQHNG